MSNIDDQITRYVDELKRYNSHTNIYSKNAYSDLPFHISDCRGVAELLGNKGVVADLGSGAGLPSVLIAIHNPGQQVIAIESKEKKRKFLHHIATALSLNNLEVFEGDIQRYVSQQRVTPRWYTAKAFASVDKIKWYLRQARTGGAGLLVPVSAGQAKDLKSESGKIVEGRTVGDRTSWYYIERF